MFEYTSVSNTKMFTFSPEAITWSKPPKPISYAHPSPPKIQTDFFANKSAYDKVSLISLAKGDLDSSSISNRPLTNLALSLD
ncbi:MAG: hypothetical protein K2M43_00940 [Mycoplasmoidaceae bacterium]|nr:hypothetical protein [Mycoplasmoidaceae bacterium]